jgi:hypothetical protein
VRPVVWLIGTVVVYGSYTGHDLELVQFNIGVFASCSWPPGWNRIHRRQLVHTNVVEAHWTNNSPNDSGNEVWFAEIPGYSPRGTVTLRFALYVEDADGYRSWDNNGGWDYYVSI